MRCAQSILLALASLAALAVQTGTGSADTPFSKVKPLPRFEAAECVFAPAETIRVLCGALVVPESRRGAGEVILHLPVVIFSPATAPADAPLVEPVVFLNGGPGGAVFLGSDNGWALWHATARRWFDVGARHVVLFTQRGTNNPEAEALACPAIRNPAVAYGASREPGGSSEWQGAAREAIATCRDRARRAGHDLLSYSTDENVNDLKELLDVLNVHKARLYGVSYGARVALRFMAAHPGRISKAVLDSPDPPGHKGVLRIGQNLSDALTSIGALCRRDPPCKRAMPDLIAAVEAVTERLARVPPEIPAVHPETGEVWHIRLTPAIFLNTLLLSAYEPGGIARIPYAVATTQNGVYTQISDLVAQALLLDWGVNFGTAASVDCQHFGIAEHRRILRAEIARFPAFAGYLRDVIDTNEIVCSTWLEGETFTPEDRPVRPAVPTLVLSGALDPVTPLAIARDLAESLPNASLRVYPDAGHSVLPANDCAWRDVGRFLHGVEAHPAEPCDAADPPVRFALPRFR